MSDPFNWSATGLTGPASNAFAVTPSDSADLAVVTRGLYIGGAGDLSLVLKGNSSPVSFAGVPAGTVLPLRAARVRATGTTATNIVGLY